MFLKTNYDDLIVLDNEYTSDDEASIDIFSL